MATINKKYLMDYCESKIQMKLFPRAVLAFIGGFFLALGCFALIRIMCWDGYNKESSTFGISLFLSGCAFSVGLICCFVIGGNIFTSTLFSFGCVLNKKAKVRHMVFDLVWVFIWNYVGCIFLASIVVFCGLTGSSSDLKELGNITYTGGFYSTVDGTTNNLLWGVYKLTGSKVEMPYWQTFLTAIVTNMIIVAIVISWVNNTNKAISLVAIFLLIVVFIVGGYQHIVANMFYSTVYLFHGLLYGLHVDVAKVFYNCIIPSALGNLVGGLFFFYLFYLLATNKEDKCNKIQSKVVITKESDDKDGDKQNTRRAQ